MPEEDEIADYLPTEILLFIFTLLPAKDLTRIRQVCHRWCYLVDGLQNIESLWRRHCLKDFAETSIVARRNARGGLGWYNIYKSLSLWPRLSSAGEISDEFAFATSYHQQISNFQVLEGGIIGVQKRQSIEYYNIETLERVDREPLEGGYLKYLENAHIIVILNYQLHLYVIRKFAYTLGAQPNMTFIDVKLAVLVDHVVYYVNLNDEVFGVYMSNDTIVVRNLGRCQEGIMCIGYSDNVLNVLTFERNILTFANNKMMFKAHLDDTARMLSILRQHNLLEHLDWRVYFQWMFIMNRIVPQGPLRDIIVVRAYGDMLFVGSNWGVLRIYHAPRDQEEIDLFNMIPIKQYNFMERQDCPVLSDLCPILQIDVLEFESGHTLIAAMPKKIAVINYIHGSTKSSEYQVLPYKDAQYGNIMQLIDRCI